MVKRIFIFILTLMIGFMISARDAGYFLDSRDGQKYATVKIGDSIWLAQNFNYKVKTSWIYDNKEENEQKYGRLYTWEAALKACPDGWHLPTDEEWKTLEKTLKIPNSQLDEIDYRLPVDTRGFDSFKKTFNLVMSGCRKHDTGRFLGINLFAFFWTSSSYKKIYAWKRAFDKNEKGIGRHTFNKKNAIAVRYVKD
ncbi:MAG: hypothetical protein KAS65_11000 [Candidatus Aminicenantes bacterium]|nr:hypothetical protein [Candidatus Aminicenantes bacterium]